MPLHVILGGAQPFEFAKEMDSSALPMACNDHPLEAVRLSDSEDMGSAQGRSLVCPKLLRDTLREFSE